MDKQKTMLLTLGKQLLLWRTSPEYYRDQGWVKVVLFNLKTILFLSYGITTYVNRIKSLLTHYFQRCFGFFFLCFDICILFKLIKSDLLHNSYIYSYIYIALI